PQPAAHTWIVVDRIGDGVDELDDELGHEIAGGGLAAEDEGARGNECFRVALETQVEGEDVQGVEVLALVFVDALDLNVEKRFGVHVHAGSQSQISSEIAFRLELYFAPSLLKCLIVRERLQFPKLGKIEQPLLSNGLGDEGGERS